MKRNLLIFLAFCFSIINSYGQTAEEYYNKGMEKANAGELEKAIKLLDKSIELKDDEYVAWYNRGIMKAMLDLEEEAIEDFNHTLTLYPDYKKAYLNRGTSKKHLSDYDGALEDYNMAIVLDENYADGYYNRGLLYEFLQEKDLSCKDFTKALELGTEKAQIKVDECNDPSSSKVHAILRLTEQSEDETYGFAPDNPIKCGFGPNGGPANQRAYLDLLRDGKGKPIKYERVGSCCAYESENGLMGMAMVDRYEIKYKTEKGKKKKTIVYISFYDYELPKILVGFGTIK